MSTDYNIWADLLIMGALLVVLAISIRVLGKKPAGATKASRKEILRHQGERRVLMGEMK